MNARVAYSDRSGEVGPRRSRFILNAVTLPRHTTPKSLAAVRSFVPSIEGEGLAMTGTNSTHQCLQNVDSAYLPPAKQLYAGRHALALG